jgi:hypothetical protein
MAGRRLMLFVVLLLVIGAMASATVPRERRAPAEPSPLPAPAQLAPAAGVVQARLPAKRSVRATVGDVLRIDVRSGTDDVAEVPALGVSEPVGPGIPAELVFDADHPGRFPVTLRDAGRRIGTVVVRAAG